MKKQNTKTRYILSCIVDYGILLAVTIPIIKSPHKIDALLFVIAMWIIQIVILSQDKILGGASIGKRIFGIKIVSYECFSEITWGESLIRRFLELLYSYKIIFWRLHLDIDKISNSRIVHKSYQAKPNRTREVNLLQGNHRLNIKREKAFYIDFLIISWLVIASYILRLDYFKNLINDYWEHLYLLLTILIGFTIWIYFAFKDFIYKNASLGKRKLGICIVDRDGKRPSELQMIIRGSIMISLWPIEIVLFLLNKRQIAEMLTYTKVIEDSNTE
jgi:uncharacterized RDD family membrane protein YckC